MIPATLLAKKGDKILPAFQELVRWIDSQRLVSVDDRVLINTTPNGSLVSMVDRPPSILTPLRVILSGAKNYGVTEGYINGKLPEAFTDVPIVDADGVPNLRRQIPEKKPFFVFATVNFNENFSYRRSFISADPVDNFNSAALKAKYFPETKTIQADIPLAFMRSDRFIQFVTHNLQVRAYNHNGSYRVIYWPA